MAQNKVTIDVEARFIDNITSAAHKAGKVVDDLGKKKPKVTVDLEDDDARKDIKQTSKELDNLGKKNPTPKVGIKDNASKLLDKLESKTKSLADKVTTMAIKVKDSDALKELNQIEEKAKGLARKTWTAVVKIKDAATTPLKAITKSLFNIKTLAAGIVGGLVLGKVGSIAAGAVSDVADRENITTQFKVLLGSQKAAEKRVAELTQFASETPYTRDEIFQASKVLQTYTQGALATKDSTGGLKMVGDIAAATGADYTQVASYMGRLYNETARGGNSIGEPLAFLREMGALSAEQEKKIKEIAQGSGDISTKWAQIAAQFKGVEGMMEEMSYNTENLLLGVSTLAKNYWRIPIGEGIMESFKPFLVRFQTWRGENKDAMQAWYNGVKRISSLLTDKVLTVVEHIGKRAYKILSSDEFQNADIFGKIGMLWKGVISNPFADWWSDTVVPWWNTTAVPWLTDRASSAGKLIGEGLSGGLLALLGVDVADAAGEGASIAANFVKGFMDGFDGSAVAESIIGAIGDVWKALPLWAKLLVGGAGAMKATSLVGNLAGSVANIGGMLGLGGAGAAAAEAGTAGAAGTAAAGAAGGLLGKAGAASGALSNAAVKFAKFLGAEKYLGTGLMGASNASLAAIGTGAAIGGVAAGATALSGGRDLYKGFADKNLNAGSGAMGDAYKDSAFTKLGGVGVGAAAGFALGGPAGALIGAGLGGVAGWMAGNRIKKEAAEGITSLKELEQAAKSSSDAAEALEKRQTAMVKKQKELFGTVKMSNAEIQDFIEGTLGKSTQQLDTFKSASNTAKASQSTFKQLASSLDMLDFKAKNGYKFDTRDIEEYTLAVENYTDAAKDMLTKTQTESLAAVDALYGSDSAAGSKRKEAITSMFAGMESELSKASEGLSKAYSDALADGVINADEQKAIQAWQEKVTNITQKMNDAETLGGMGAMKIKFGSAEMDADSLAAMQDEINTWISDQKVSLDEALEVELTNLSLDGELTDEEIAQAQAAYEERLNGIVLQARNTQIDILMDQTGIQKALGTDAEGVKSTLNSILDYSLNNGLEPVEITPDLLVKITGDESLAKIDTATLDTIMQPLQTIYDQTIEIDATAKANVETHAAENEVNTALNKLNGTFVGPHEAPVNVTARVHTTVVGDTAISVGGAVTSLAVSAVRTAGKARGGLMGLNIPAYAGGGMVSGGAQLITVAEEGSPEMIIPLSSQRRSRGLDLWSKAGQMMGVPGFANGGLVGNDEGIRNTQYSNGEATGGSQSVQVDVGGVTVEINVNGDETSNMADAIKNQGESIAETVAGILADAFNAQFANTPARGGA